MIGIVPIWYELFLFFFSLKKVHLIHIYDPRKLRVRFAQYMIVENSEGTALSLKPEPEPGPFNIVKMGIDRITLSC